MQLYTDMSSIILIGHSRGSWIVSNICHLKTHKQDLTPKDLTLIDISLDNTFSGKTTHHIEALNLNAMHSSMMFKENVHQAMLNIIMKPMPTKLDPKLSQTHFDTKQSKLNKPVYSNLFFSKKRKCSNPKSRLQSTLLCR